MSSASNKDLCLKLLKAESAKEVVDILKDAGYWDDLNHWKFYGDRETNEDVIGNQQNKPEYALIEKLTNSIDSILISKCLEKSIDLSSDECPKSPVEAVEKLYKDFPIIDGRLENLTNSQRTKLAEQSIFLVASGGSKNPNYSIIDFGEGQTPNNIPNTFVSLGKGNKTRYKFCQGKYNMGGSGALRFCDYGEVDKRKEGILGGIQLIISKRNQNIENDGDDDSFEEWGFTITRREVPSLRDEYNDYQGRTAVTTYLAPDNKVLRFKSNKLPLLPDEDKDKKPIPYSKNVDHGSLVKLFEYGISAGLTLNEAIWSNRGLHHRLNFLFTSMPLPIRTIETRNKYTEKLRNHKSTLQGLRVHIDDEKNKEKILEKNFPVSLICRTNEQEIPIQIYAFKPQKMKGKRGILIGVNGQTHREYPRRYFKQKKYFDIGGNLWKDLLVLIDFSKIDEDTFAEISKGDRTSFMESELYNKIFSDIAKEVRNNGNIKDLIEKRRKLRISDTFDDNELTKQILNELISKHSFMMQLLEGKDIMSVKSLIPEVDTLPTLNRFPTYFKLLKEFNSIEPKKCHIGQRFRIQYESDVENDYLDRVSDSGEFRLEVKYAEGKDDFIEEKSYSINPYNGIFTLNIELPKETEVGDVLEYKSIVNDVNNPNPFTHSFFVEVLEKQKPTKPDPKPKPKRKTLQNLNYQFPEPRRIKKEDWVDENIFGEEPCTEEDAMVVIRNGEGDYDYYINMDNKYLQKEKFDRKDDPKAIEELFVASLMLISIFITSNEKDFNNNDPTEDLRKFTRIISRIIIPIMSMGNEIDAI